MNRGVRSIEHLEERLGKLRQKPSLINVAATSSFQQFGEWLSDLFVEPATAVYSTTYTVFLLGKVKPRLYVQVVCSHLGSERLYIPQDDNLRMWNGPVADNFVAAMNAADRLSELLPGVKVQFCNSKGVPFSEDQVARIVATQKLFASLSR